MNPRQSKFVLRYLADLAPTGKRATDVVTRKSEFAWLGGKPALAYSGDGASTRLLSRSAVLRRLAAIDSLHPTEHLLRLGWLFAAGTIDVDGTSTRFCLPLLSVPVRLGNIGVSYQLIHTGNLEMHDDLFDWDARLELEESTDPFGGGSPTQEDAVVGQMPRLAEWVAQAMGHADLPEATLRGGKINPVDLRGEPGLSVIVGAGIYTVRDIVAPNTAGVLRSWSYQSVDHSAFDVLYGQTPNTRVDRSDDDEIRSPLPLNRSQREALHRLRSERVSVVSGPPGTGKSHLVAAAAIDQVAAGKSVLIATQSGHAAAVIADLLERHPGPRFVRFGNRDDRESVAAELGDGLARPLSADEHAARNDRAIAAGTRVHRLRKSIGLLLQREIEFNSGLDSRQVSLLVAAEVPGVLAEDFDLEEAERLLVRSRDGIPLLNGFGKRRAARKLRELAQCDVAVTLDDIDAGLDAARAERAVRRGLAGGGLSLIAAWEELERAESDYRDAIGRAIEAQRRSRRNSRRKSTRAVATLASALRSGRARRRQLLRELAADDFLDVLPLWIGTLQDIDDTLPVIPAAFDLVIFDEASQIDQIRAAPALARAKQAMIVGDPRQLRHVSFVSDDAMEEAAERHSLTSYRDRLLDVRRNSLFDTGAATTSITWLDEHFRSVPHIIRFSDRHFYSGNLRLMTQHPRNETRDAIHTVRVAGTRDDGGVNHDEVAETMRQIEAYAAAGATSIGVISPFRAQADALEEAILATYGPEDVDRLGLRSGTVHAFQGNERDVVIASLAIDAAAAAGSLRFLQNPNLFNVLVTRAKREMVIVTSVDPANLPSGLLTEYLRHAEHAPNPADAADPVNGWTGEIVSELQAFGMSVVPSYPVAGWVVDLAMGEKAAAIGVETTVHPEGAAAHIERYLALRRAGWTMADAFQSRWLTDAAGAAEMLSKQLLRRHKELGG